MLLNYENVGSGASRGEGAVGSEISYTTLIQCCCAIKGMSKGGEGLADIFMDMYILLLHWICAC